MGRDARTLHATPGVEAVLGSSRPRARRRRAPLLGGGGGVATKTLVIAAAVLLGLAAGLDGKLTLAAIFGLGLIAVVVANMTAGVLVFAVAQTLESLPDVAGGASVAQLVGAFLFLGWLTAVLLGRGEERTGRDIFVSNPAVILLLGLFLAWVGFSALWAEDTRRTMFFFVYLGFVATLFPIVLAAIRTVRHVVLLYIALVSSALAAGLFAVQNPSAAATGDRLVGAGFNPNQLGLYLIVGCVLAATLACNRALSRPARILAGVAAVVCPAFQVMTASRGAMVGLVVALLFAPLAAGRGRRLLTLAVIVVVAATAVAAAGAFAPDASVNRLTHWEQTGSGRADLWTIAMRMVDDKPLTGIGAGNFQVSSIHYLLEPGAIIRDEYIVDRPQETHNIYLAILSELGIVGLTLFLSIVAYCVVCLLRAIQLAVTSGDRQLEILARGLLVTLVGLLSAMFFSSQTLSKELYLLLALTIAMLAIAKRASTASNP